MTTNETSSASTSAPSAIRRTVLVALVAMLALGASGCGFDVDVDFGDSTKGSGVVETRTIDVNLDGVKKIEVVDVWSVEVRIGDDHGVEVTTDDNLFDHAEVKVSGGTLRLGMTGSMRDSAGFKAVITVGDLTDLEVRDVAKATVMDVSADRLNLELRDVAVVKIDGTTDNLDLSIHDTSKLDAEDLLAGDVTIEARDVSKSVLSVSGKIMGSAADVAKVEVVGAEQVSITTADVASVSTR